MQAQKIEKSDLSNRQEQILAAVRKMDQGQKLFIEGQLEFQVLTQEPTGYENRKTKSGGKNVTKDVQKLVPKKAKKVIANKEARRKRKASAKLLVEKNQAKLKEKILKIVRGEEYANVTMLQKKANATFYPVKKAVDDLVKSNQLRYVLKANPSNNVPYSYLALT